jgi:integrase
MKKHIHKISVPPYHNAKRPHLKFEVNFRQDGKRSRKFFKTEAQAKSWAAHKNTERAQHGREYSEFPERLRVIADEARELLRPFDKSIMDAAQFYVKHLRDSEKSCTAEELVRQLLAKKEKHGASVRHLGDLRVRLTKFAEKFDGQKVGTITTGEIEDWLDSLSVAPVTRNNFRRLVILMFNYAVKRGYAKSNPAKETGKAREPKTKTGILTVEQASALLVNAGPEILPYIAIGLFAGLRRAEIERLDWSEIDFDSGHIEVTAEKSKPRSPTASSRCSPICGSGWSRIAN